MGADHDIYYKAAIASTLLSAFTVLFIAIAIPAIYMKSTKEMMGIEIRAKQFKVDTDRIWTELNSLGNPPESRTTGKTPILFSRKKRSPWDGGAVCQGCTMLTCPQGLPGSGGNPGEDGFPGMPGNPGHAGDDGFDVELAPEDDMPCTICPAGPPGPRGPQGERGMSGAAGSIGEIGSPGNQGMDGNPGLPGLPGDHGPRGLTGPPGVQGKTIIAGVGIKGPKGPPGPAGPMGKQGPIGKNAKDPGSPGSPGESGPMGPPGDDGKVGEEGPYGPPGEPGMPASYCPSDCGVSHIVAPMSESPFIDVSPSSKKNELAYDGYRSRHRLWQ